MRWPEVLIGPDGKIVAKGMRAMRSRNLFSSPQETLTLVSASSTVRLQPEHFCSVVKGLGEPAGSTVKWTQWNGQGCLTSYRSC